tara:strand:- start:605 stop:2128 length:1524 start_codon:yes stop_codon:yes gene_type:complete
MHIFNVRLGLATNSSSTHSLIFLDEEAQDSMGERERFNIPEWDAEGNIIEVEPEMVEIPASEFGWQYFTAASEQAKKNYLAIMLAQAMQKCLPPSVARIVVQDWLGVEPEADGYIDHQSIICLPMEMTHEDYRSQPFVSKRFFDELTEFFLQPDLKILGGNDNDEEVHELAQRPGAMPVNLPLPVESSGWFCRKDELYNYWALFNHDTGSKIRFRLARGDMRNVPRRAYAPELVDVKITNYCPFNCEFCYQDSVPEGTHASSQDIYSIASELQDCGTFEVALGGGEPTMHPEFIDILSTFRRYGIVPNFTTRNLAWLRDPIQVAAIMEHVGAFAYSAQDPKEISKLNALLTNAGIKGDRWPYGYETRYNKAKVTIHVVMGTIDRYRFENLLKACHEYRFGVTLLGYKTVGRGEDVRQADYGWWLGCIRRLQDATTCPPIGIDTVMVQQFEEQLEQAGIPGIMYQKEEGMFSCYIDAVENKIGPSSFCEQDDMVDFTRNTFLETFQGF